MRLTKRVELKKSKLARQGLGEAWRGEARRGEASEVFFGQAGSSLGNRGGDTQ